MCPSISENKRGILLDLIGQLDDELSDFMHQLEEDRDVTDKTWKASEVKYTKLSQIWRSIFEEIYYT